MLKKEEIVKRIKVDNCKSPAKVERYLHDIYDHKIHSYVEMCIFAGYVAGICGSMQRNQKSR